MATHGPLHAVGSNDPPRDRDWWEGEVGGRLLSCQWDPRAGWYAWYELVAGPAGTTRAYPVAPPSSDELTELATGLRRPPEDRRR
jgi:hypothetical protein